ncbi:unnamed protein product [Prorocentrum cordatum]|uniref:Uncharacterized protein n=1 Tax=Prorocentrum cordatum TaxID=2364126 RepID=A0ABN9T1E4_9DINO|nr:unnamed protein product [Polarella glacialis]
MLAGHASRKNVWHWLGPAILACSPLQISRTDLLEFAACPDSFYEGGPWQIRAERRGNACGVASSVRPERGSREPSENPKMDCSKAIGKKASKRPPGGAKTVQRGAGHAASPPAPQQPTGPLLPLESDLDVESRTRLDAVAEEVFEAKVRRLLEQQTKTILDAIRQCRSEYRSPQHRDGYVCTHWRVFPERRAPESCRLGALLSDTTALPALGRTADCRSPGRWPKCPSVES